MTRNSKKFQKQKTNTCNTPKPKPTPPVTAKEMVSRLSFVSPTDTVELPTKGKFYPTSNPFFGVESVEIRHMTAKEEDLLSSISADTSVNIYEKLIDGLLVEKSLKASMLCEEDKTAILIKARASGYGSEYKVKDYCYNCQNSVVMSYDLNKTSVIEPELSEASYNPEKNQYDLTLPKCKIPISIKSFSEEDQASLLEEKEKKDSLGIEFNYMVAFLRKIIISIVGEQDRQVINELIEVMPAADAKFLNSFYDNCRPKITTAQDVQCPSCNAISRREVPVSWAFFRLNQ